MAEREAINKRYAYQEMSNKVQQADRSLLRPRGNDEPTGEVETLVGRTDIGRMGDRVGSMVEKETNQKKRPQEIIEKMERVRQKKQKKHSSKKNSWTTTTTTTSTTTGGGKSILDLTNITGYQPSHPGSQAVYENMLNLIGSKELLGTQPTSILRDAAEEVISILKDDDLRDPERQEAISKLLTGKSKALSNELFSQLVAMGKGLNDYEEYHHRNHTTTMTEEEKVDEEMGVAVVFEDSEEEGSDDGVGVGTGAMDGASDIEEDEVVDIASTSSSEPDDALNLINDDDNDNDHNNNNQQDDNTNRDEEMMVQGGTNHPNDEEQEEDGTFITKKKKRMHSQNRILSVHEIDAHFLQRQLSSRFDDANICANMANDVFDVIDLQKKQSTQKDTDDDDLRECENKLLVLLGFESFEFIKLILNNRVKIWACVSLKRAKDDKERDVIEQILSNLEEGKRVWEELNSKSKAQDWTRDRMRGITDSLLQNRREKRQAGVNSALDSIGIKSMEDDPTNQTKSNNEQQQQKEEEGAMELDLDSLAFRDGNHTMSNKKCDLPEKSWRAMKKGYEEVHVPAIRNVISKDEKLVPIQDLPSWTHDAFRGMDKLNRIQSKVCDAALKSSENMLLCAPTGAGKTNVAMLTMLNILGQYRLHPKEQVNEENYDLKSFKIVYVAPMKALVQEVVKNFSKRLAPYGITARELSGDSSLTRQQISETQLIVTTPEKWDIVTRQGEGRAYTQLVRLVIIDEIHLLHDDRGPVLESIVSRIIRQVENTQDPVRLVGLSATLPNYDNVATFLRVKPDKGMFFFDHSYRPVPLQMQYIGITERNAFKRFQLQNEICYEKALVQRKNGNQMLIFVHSRAETGKTAKALRDMALEKDELTNFVRDGSATQEILREELSTVKNNDLKEVLQYGFAIHHAGMTRTDRELVEDLFADGHIAVLCCTATLSWGVNLPAHAVIIKGTQIYDPTKGKWAELSPLDVLQMLGRAGRPQYDSEGEGIIMTAHSELQYYLSLTNLQLPVESQFIKTLPDHLNAEVVLGSVQTIKEAVDWLTYTFLYVRMLQNPSLYGIMNPEKTLKDDPTLKRRRLDLAHTAACLLEKSNLIRYDRKSGALQSSPLGRISSQYYISHTSMALYSRHLRPNMSDIELLRLFSLSGEFTHITVREEEKLELSKLAAKVPIPVKESPGEPSAKVNILLQAYISRLKLDGFALISDMAFIQQSAARIMRALFEIAMRRNWSSLTKLTLNFANMVAHRIWKSQSPLRQFKHVPEVVTRKLERKSDIDWPRYFDLTPSDLGELVGVPKMGRTLHKLVHQFPKLELSAHIQPITRSMLRIDLSLVPDFQYDIKVHGYVQIFHVIVEDVNGENILHHEEFLLRSSASEEEHSVLFTVPILDPLPPTYFIRLVSDRWLHCHAVLPISFNHMILPPKFPPPTELLDLQPLPPTALGEQAFVKLFNFKEFNPIQTQVFHELFKTDRNSLICAPSGSGKTACAEFAILRMIVSDPNGKCVYVAPKDEIAKNTASDWTKRFGMILPKGQVVQLTGETTPDIRLLAQAKIIVCTVKQWDSLSRRWRQRKSVQSVSLFIIDDLHFLGGEIGPTVEVITSRMRYISSQKQQGRENGNSIRMIGLSASLANAREVGEWMGVPIKSLFNFSPKVRPTPLEIYLQSFDQSNFSSRLMAMAKPVYNSAMRHSNKKPTIVFVPSRRQAQLTAIDIMTYRENLDGGSFLGKDVDMEQLSLVTGKLKEQTMQQVVKQGIGYVHDGMSDSDWEIIVDLYSDGILNLLVCPADLCWRLREVAHLVIIMGTETYDGRERKYLDYPIADLLHMMGKASRQGIDSSGKCVILCHTPKKDHLRKLLYEPLPIESHLDHYLHDHFNSEIVTKTIASMQDAVDYITWTFLYRRLTKNPNYYNLQGVSNVHLSEHMSEMVETVLGDLEESKCCQMTDEGDVSPLNLGMISAYYYIQYTTVDLIASSVTSKTKTRGVMEILSASSEFASLPIRHGEERSLKIIARNLKHQLPDSAQFHDANTKALILLQCHFSRTSVSADMRKDQQIILGDSINLIQGIVDVISSNGWLKPALAAMELSQMVVQGLWNKDNVLMQIPHFSKEIIARCEAHEGEDTVESVFDILTIDDDVRDDLLRLPDEKMADVAVFCNNYPNVEVTFEIKDEDDITAGDPVQLAVKLEREVDEEEMDEEEMAQLGNVSAPLFPKEKKEGWWIVIGDTKTNSLLSVKRVNLQIKQNVLLEFVAPEDPGDYNLTLFCMSDSYLGCDQEYSVKINVALGESESESDDSSTSDAE